MKDINSPIRDEEVRGEYSRKIRNLLEQNNLNWWASPAVEKPEIFIRPKDNLEWENFHSITRICVQLKEGKINFGVSGYFPVRISYSKKFFEDKGYIYHDKGQTEDGRPKGRWWLVKSLDTLDSLVNELKDIEPILSEK